MAKKILLIDDEPDVRQVLQLTLELEHQWQVDTAASGQEGIQKAQTNPPDVILLDIMMPGLDGVATLNQLQTLPETDNIPVIFLTAKLETEQKRYTETGAVAVLSKLIDPLTFGENVIALMGW
ncbi:MAG: response regulator [Jaaginema sp. PMC 1079.18]|nr:response regulator [Jaaginema sp. PMC 1080.18]MEC4850332.1 response regulator [Jaaginema sp. PMC 1079.18]MEC4865585.1 response regulator [Jaaginema sp. PMC 1078.18]